MTKEQIKDLVNKKIVGQGTMVDLGNALPQIIDGILDLLPDVPTPQPAYFDLSGFEELDSTDVSSVIPSNYVPKIGDIIKGGEYGFEMPISGIIYNGNNSNFICGFRNEPGGYAIFITKAGNRWLATTEEYL